MPDRITCILIYFLIGALMWAFLKIAGAIDKSFANCAKRGMFLSPIERIGASLVSILVWPYFVWVIVRGLGWACRGTAELTEMKQDQGLVQGDSRVAAPRSGHLGIDA